MTDSLHSSWTFSGEPDLHGYLAEAAVAAYLCDLEDTEKGTAKAVYWLGGNHKGVDIQDSTRAVDVKKAFIEEHRLANGEKQVCLGFMGSDRGTNEEGKKNPQVRDNVSHYALVEVLGGIKISVSESLSVDIDSRVVRYRIFMIPREFVNGHFAPEYTRAGTMGTGRNHYAPLSEVLQFLVFDSTEPMDSEE